MHVCEMMKQHSRIQIAKCDLFRFWRMKYLEMLADRKQIVSSVGLFLVTQRLGSCYIPVAFEARMASNFGILVCGHFVAVFVWEVPQWSSNHGSGLKKVQSGVEWKVSSSSEFKTRKS